MARRHSRVSDGIAFFGRCLKMMPSKNFFRRWPSTASTPPLWRWVPRGYPVTWMFPRISLIYPPTTKPPKCRGRELEGSAEISPGTETTQRSGRPAACGNINFRMKSVFRFEGFRIICPTGFAKCPKTVLPPGAAGPRSLAGKPAICQQPCATDVASRRPPQCPVVSSTTTADTQTGDHNPTSPLGPPPPRTRKGTPPPTTRFRPPPHCRRRTNTAGYDDEPFKRRVEPTVNRRRPPRRKNRG